MSSNKCGDCNLHCYSSSICRFAGEIQTVHTIPSAQCVCKNTSKCECCLLVLRLCSDCTKKVLEANKQYNL